MTRQEAEIILQSKFKLHRFYDGQWDTIEKILKGERVLLIEKTGFGKSLCFQFPAILFNGTTVIFSPLIALMRDQVKKLNSLGISAKCVNSEQTQEENSHILNEARAGKIKILILLPKGKKTQSGLKQHDKCTFQWFG
jgi:ATP-dependent DNA helicase RecQ